MSDEQRKDNEVEGHVHRHAANDEPRNEEDTEVEGHLKYGANDEPREDDEVEGHVMKGF